MIRPARPEDADVASSLIQETIGPIGWSLTGVSSDREAARVVAEFFARGGNRLGYEHTLVAQEDGRLAGLVVAYPGARANELDEPFRARLRALNLSVRIDPETDPDEFYVDTLVVAEAWRGRGLGRALLLAAEDRARAANAARVGLLSREDNEPAFSMYRRLGYRPIGERVVSGERYAHLVRALPPRVS